MAAAHGHLQDGDGLPVAFRHAVDALQRARVRHEVELDPVPAPKRLAPHAYALEAVVLADGEELADGRLVLLHDPEGQQGWHGAFRVVTLARAELEPEMAADPLLPEVSWSWLTGALEAHGAAYDEASGTVSRNSSHYFGRLADRPDSTELEIRASWTPLPPAPAVPQPGAGGGAARAGREEPLPDFAAHLAAWCDALCTGAGLPPAAPAPRPGPGAAAQPPSVLPLPKRRGPHSTH
jgi:hypothetical protein